MGLSDFEPPCENPYECIDEQVRECIDGPVGRQESDEGYTYYVGMVKRGRAFVTVQPNVWLYLDPSVRSGIDAYSPPQAVSEHQQFERVPDGEKWRSSFGHRVKVRPVGECELSAQTIRAVRQSYGQVRRTTLR
ncbi:hypothetical protein [Halorussus salinisoli]|uniref:hypothetical protein n=1 Tax=Halorussus salinisoli TaxID=2558242 RepID=UPI0010C23D20|nr:hypothetical protein [Halorussus salinisoli]